MAASSTRSKPAAKKAASKAKPAAKATSARGKVSAKAKTSAKATAKKAAERPAKAAEKPAAEKPAKAAGKAKVAEPAPAKKPARARAAEAPVAEPPAAEPAPAKKTKKPAEPTTPVQVKAPTKAPAAPELAAAAPAAEPAPPADGLPAGLPIAAPPPPPVERKKSVLEIAEEDEEFDDEPPMPTLENLDALLDRIHRLAQDASESEIREELAPLVEQLEQIEDPAALPRLLDLLEDNDPHDVYWNVLFVLEKFDAYLRVLLDGLQALHHRAPEWAYTCVIRILNTRGAEDDCTAAFEQLINAGPADTRALMLQILRELSEHPETDEDQRQNIARTITAIGGDVAREPAKTPEPAPEAAS